MKRRFFSIGGIASFIAQLLLFFGAVSALTLLYLTYRYNTFLESFIVIGMSLILPWLTISLLPTILVLDDKELRRELLWGQLATMLAAFVILYGLSVSINFDTVILAKARSCITAPFTECPAWISQLNAVIGKAIELVVAFYNTTIAPLFS